MSDVAKVKLSVKRIGRKRRFAGWGLISIGLLVAGVWFASRWCMFRWESSERMVRVAHGQLLWAAPGPSHGAERVVDVMDPDERGWVWRSPKDVEWGRPDGVYLWLYSHATEHRRNPPGTIWWLVLWPFAPILFATGGCLLRSGFVARGRAMSGTCVACGYDRGGLDAGAVCPECGEDPACTGTSHSSVKDGC